MTSTPSPNPLRKALADTIGAAEKLSDLLHQLEARGVELKPQQDRSWQVATSIIERARSALAADDAAGGWRDISTAPKDGIFWVANHLVERLAYWKDGILTDAERDRPISFWFTPTHWQPIPTLPPAPAGADEEEDGR